MVELEELEEGRCHLSSYSRQGTQRKTVPCQKHQWAGHQTENFLPGGGMNVGGEGEWASIQKA